MDNHINRLKRNILCAPSKKSQENCYTCKEKDSLAIPDQNTKVYAVSQEILSGKLLYEFKTIEAMVKIYCKAHHKETTWADCQDCQEFLAYAHEKLDRCPYGQNKPTCNKCPVHCYKPHMRAKAKEIMVYGGPRMLLPHPIMAIKHLLAERQPVPGKPPAAASNRHQRIKIKQIDSN